LTVNNPGAGGGAIPLPFHNNNYMESRVKNMHIGRITKQIVRDNPDIGEEEARMMAEQEFAKKFPDSEEVPGELPIDTPTPEPTKEESPEIAQMRAELNRNRKEMAEMRALMNKMINNKTPVEDKKEESLLDDYLDAPVSFYCHTFGLIIGSYRYRGKEMLPPNGIISFRNTARMQVSKLGQRDARIVSLCSFSTRSRREAEYIRNSPQYGVIIFEKSNEARNVELQMVDIMSDVSSEVNHRSQAQLIQMALDRGVKVTDNVDDLRRMLIDSLTKERMQKMRDMSESLAKKTGSEKLARENPTMVSE
jgi:hypothetical protein